MVAHLETVGLRLSEKWRPTRLDDVVGQDSVVRKLSGFIANPYSSCWLFKGNGGCGKSAVARLVAELLGCHQYRVLVATDISTRDGAEKFVAELGHSSLFDPWNLYIVEELSQIKSAEAKEVLKVALSSENMPGRAIVLATSNGTKQLQKEMFEEDSGSWLLQRFSVLNFSSNGHFEAACLKRLHMIWKAEAGDGVPLPAGWQRWGYMNGDTLSFSMRVALDEMQSSLLEIAAAECVA